MSVAFTAPWAGPGNSDGGASNSEGSFVDMATGTDFVLEDDPGLAMASTEPWPGPGNSDG
jgi:hypothetical protein